MASDRFWKEGVRDACRGKRKKGEEVYKGPRNWVAVHAHNKESGVLEKTAEQKNKQSRSKSKRDLRNW